jgi:hypothetical protein
MALFGWFDGEIRPDGWFDAEIQPAGWFDTEVINTAAGGGAVNYTLACDAGAYSIAGQAATLTLARKLALDAGAYAYSGVAATLNVERKLPLAAGAYTYAGVDAVLNVERKLALDAGAYAIAGVDATLDYVPGTANYTLACDAGAYVISGGDAELVYSGAVPETTQQFSGGFVPFRRRKSAKEIEQERIRLGIIPATVAQVVTKAAQDAVAQATQQREPDVVKWAEDNEAMYQRQIRRDIARSNMVWDKAYRRLFEIALHDALMQEEETVIHMLMHEL